MTIKVILLSDSTNNEINSIQIGIGTPTLLFSANAPVKDVVFSTDILFVGLENQVVLYNPTTLLNIDTTFSGETFVSILYMSGVVNDKVCFEMMCYYNNVLDLSCGQYLCFQFCN